MTDQPSNPEDVIHRLHLRASGYLYMYIEAYAKKTRRSINQAALHLIEKGIIADEQYLIDGSNRVLVSNEPIVTKED